MFYRHPLRNPYHTGTELDVLRNSLIKYLVNNSYFNLELKANFSRVTVEPGENLTSYCADLVSLNGEKQEEILTYKFLIVRSSNVEIIKYYCRSSLSTVVALPSETKTGVVSILLSVMKIYIPTDLPNVGSKSLRNRNFQHSLPPSPGYRLIFTLAVANPLDGVPTWNIQTSINRHLSPLLRDLDFLGPFQVSLQVLYFADVNIKPYKQQGKFYYSKAKLPLLINPLESRLATHTSTDATLNFIVYIPPSKYTPLYIKNRKSDNDTYTSFHSPRWGGILFHNLANSSGRDVPMHYVIRTFIRQFQLLIGINYKQSSEIFKLNKETALTEWARTRLLIWKTFEHLKESLSTLSSLSKLLDKIANIVIRDDIKELVEDSVRNIEHSINHLSEGNIEQAYICSKKSFLFSEKAFYDSSLLSLLYFPDDQKYAIYVPLFLPVALPILVSFVKAVKWLKGTSTVESKMKAE